MDQHFAFYVGGNLLDIPKDESERNAHYFLRLKFIFEQKKVDDQAFFRFMFYPADEVVTFSRIFADKILFGLTYSELVEEKLYMMVNFEDSTFIVGDLDKFQEVQEAIENNLITDAKPKEIRFEDEAKMIPIGPSASFQNESGEPIEGNIDLEIEKIIVEPLEANDEVLAVKLVVGEEEDQEKIVACGNSACDIAAPVHVEIPSVTSNPEVIVIHPAENLVIAEPSEVKPIRENLPEQVLEPVKFINPNEDHGFLSLKYESKIEMDGQVFPTALHYFAYEIAKQMANGDLIKEFSVAMDIAKLSRLIEIKLTRKVAGVPSADEEASIMKIVNIRKFEQNPDIKQRLLEIKGEIIYANDNDTYWGRVWGIGPKGENRLGKILMEVRKDLMPVQEIPKEKEEKEFGLPEENVQQEVVVEKQELKKFTVANCQTLIESPYSQEQINEINKNVHYLNSSSMQDGKISNFSTEFLNRTFDAYDEILMGGELRETTNITLSWNEQPEPALFDDENGFELKLSKNVISGLFTKEGEKHQVNGVEVFDQLMVVQKFLESFIISILTSKCPSVNSQQLSKALFNHTDFGKASFFPPSNENLIMEPVSIPETEPAPKAEPAQEPEKKKLSPQEFRTKLLDFLAKDIQPTIRLNNGTEQTVIGARSIEKALLKSGERIGYDEIQEIL